MTPERSTVFSRPTDTSLGQWIAGELAGHSGESNFYPLPLGPVAFAARLALVRAAERSLDLQYQELRDDDTGRALLAELLHAADRGVRVRVLLDDSHTSGADMLLGAFAAHLQVQVRLFNPFYHRSARRLGLLIDRNRLNRRMHNKSFVADDRIAIVGGRNIGDDEFETNAPVDFSHLDVLVVGPVIRSLSSCFDQYWNSYTVLPIGPLLLEPPDDHEVRHQRAWLEHSRKSENMAAFARALPELDLVRALQENRLERFSGFCRVIADAPEKITWPAELGATHAIAQLVEILSETKRELIAISPGFVPGREGLQWLESVVRRGVRVRVLTHSFLAADSVLMHAAYARFRGRLLRAGVELYELKPSAALARRKRFGHRMSVSQSGWHAKAYLADRHAVFLGILNLESRSGGLNTEMGCVLESDALAGRLASDFDARILDEAYRVELRRGDGKMIWSTREDDREVVRESEPGVGIFRSVGRFFARVPSAEKEW